MKELLLKKSWAYLHDNFHKFSEDNQIKIALTLAAKDIPQKVEGDIKVTEMPAIQKFSGEANTENRIAEFLIGSPTSSQDS